jgi:signal transduction histidine kinase
MGAGELPRVRVELLHESERTRVTRLFFPGTTVVRKEPLGPDAGRRLQHETAILERLRGVAGIVQLAEAPRYPGSIVMADRGSRSLAGLAKPMDAVELLPLAAGLARAVAGMHAKGVLHRDITPSHIVLSPDGHPLLVDFSLATSLTGIRPEFTHHTEIVGTLAYLAPEQTGRTARPVDHRADLYALGATLYELATGEPPFGSGDPLRLAHDHLARVPVPPARVNPEVPVALSEIVMHLLEKEPDNRYQTAEGVLHDLEQARPGGPVRIGERDVPLRLLPPSRLVGRDEEVAVLAAAFEEALAGRCRGLLIAGAPGVGKTALVDELRPVVTGADGWFVAGKFDQYRRDLEFNAVHQAFRALGRLLLAEPDDELADVRDHILDAVGANAGLVTATSPEMAVLLAVPPDAGDPLTAQVRAQRAGVDVLRAVASRKRPVVLFVDDLQWAGRVPLGFVDLVLTEEQIEGLLLVGAYREDDVDTTHPMAARWREQAGVAQVRLENLPVSDTVAMVAEMLHVDGAAAAGLVEAIGPHTSGNPYETVELLNALRRDGVLAMTGVGWRWDAAAVRARLGRSEVADLVATRVDAMPEPTREVVEAMACLGWRAELGVLQTATATPASVLEERMAPALDDGLLLVEPGAREAVRFRHDRIRESVLRGLDSSRRRALPLAMARRLARVPDLYAVAAEQYLPVVDDVDDAAERHAVVALLRRAADEATVVGDHALVNALLAASLRLIGQDETGLLIEVHTRRHAALFGLGRLEEADDEYRTIDGLCTTTMGRAGATCVQVLSLTHRKGFAEALALGVGTLRELGVAVPSPDRIAGEVEGGFDELYRWLDDTDARDDLARPDITDPTLLAATRLLNAVLPAAFLRPDLATHAWVSLEAVRIWREHGPCRTLVGPAGIAAFAVVAVRGDYAAGYRALRRFLALSEARGYEPDSSQARFLFAVLSWCFEPIEHGVEAARRARRGLIACGDNTNAGFTYYPAVRGLLDCAPSLENLVAELEAGLAFVRRTGSEETAESLGSYRWLAGVLRGESGDAVGDTLPVDRHAENPLALLHAHICQAIAAAVFGDPDALARHTSAAMPLLPTDLGSYPTATAYLLRGLALAEQIRASNGSDDAELDGPMSELDAVMRWLAERAADAPDNILHLLRLVEAERAWAVGDFRAAVLAFDTARREVALRLRPWHRALIAERAARFDLAHGVEQAGYDLLAEARNAYLAWGATAKVGRLDWAYPTLRTAVDAAAEQPGEPPQRRVPVTTGTLDLLGVLSASQALSSETSIDRLHSRVVEVLSAMTGATGVHLLLWSDDRQGWLLPASSGGTAPISGTGHDHEVPMSVLRYTQRKGEPLVVADAVRDDRFARDPYFTDVECCSLLAVPIFSRGTLRALLIVENRLIRGAFTAERLDAVQLIAGQLAVSLDNAQLYAELATSRARIVTATDQARRRIERDLHDGAQQRLVSLALQLGVAQAAVPPELSELGAQLRRAGVEAIGAADELREVARGIHPAILAEGGLRPALRTLARRSPIPVELEMSADRRLPEHVEVSAYYVVAEALTNAAKHARASLVTVTVEIDDPDTVMRMVVRDDGTGGADATRGTGLVDLKDRVEALGGRIVVRSPRGAGTTVHVELPLTAANGGFL